MQARTTSFRGIRACVFDAYGTLFDVHTAVERHAEAVGPRAAELSALWRRKQLEYTWLRSLMDRYVDFWHITRDSLDHALATVGLEDAGLREPLLESYRTLDCYPEVPETLATLRASGLRLAILSNGSPVMLREALRSAGVESLMDEVLSVDSLGVYKPDRRVYQLVLDVLGVGRDEVAFQSSNAWDVAGAASFGFNVVWVNRFAQPRERLGVDIAVELGSLADLPAVVLP